MGDITLHPGQSEIFKDLFIHKCTRYMVAICSRGFGKSYQASVLSMEAINELIQLPKETPNKNVYIIAPTYAQVIDIYWPILTDSLGILQMATKWSRDTGIITFPNSVSLRLLSYESVDRMRGMGSYFTVVDEIEDCANFKDKWHSVILPCMSTRWSRKRAKELNAPNPSRALLIGTPKGYGDFYEMSNYEERDHEWKTYRFDYTKSPYLDATEIEQLRHSMDPVSFNREYMATFSGTGNNVFYCFDRKIHVVKDLMPLMPEENVHIAIDFNVTKQCSSVFVIRSGQVHFLDELQGSPDTEELAITIRARYKNNSGRKIYAYPDPSGRARKTSAPVGTTDFTILQQHGIICLAHTKAPPIVDSVNCVNKMLKTAAGEVGMYISPTCTGLIASLERTVWVDNNANTAMISKKEDIEHFSDGVRYAIEFLFPIKKHHITSKIGHHF